MTVTAGGSTTAGLCEACSADAQCGDGNECVYVGSMGASYCLQSCASGCATGYSCSSGDIWSVDGAQAPQCVPQSGSCEAPQGSCMDDSWEVNDTRSDASANPTLTPDTYDLVSCPSTTSSTRANDDWFKIVVTEDSRVDLQLAGNGETDLDLHLYHSDGTVVTAVDEPRLRRGDQHVPAGRDVLRQGQRLRPRAQRIPARLRDHRAELHHHLHRRRERGRRHVQPGARDDVSRRTRRPATRSARTTTTGTRSRCSPARR